MCKWGWGFSKKVSLGRKSFAREQLRFPIWRLPFKLLSRYRALNLQVLRVYTVYSKLAGNVPTTATAYIN